MTTKHTQGPWEASGRYVRTPLTEEGGGWMIADCRDVSLPSDEVRANARLISAAPELLEALEAMVERIEYYAECKADGTPNIEDWAYTYSSGDMKKARAAITKATGAQP